MPIAPARRLRDFGFAGALLLVPTLLIMIPYREVQNELEFSRAVDEFVTNSSSSSRRRRTSTKPCCRRCRCSTSRTAPTPIFSPAICRCCSPCRHSWAGAPRRLPRRNTAARPCGPRGAIALEVLAVAAVAVAVWVSATGTVRLRLGASVLVSMRSPWRAWTLAAAAVVLRMAIRRAAPLDVVGRLRRVPRILWPPVAGRPRSVRHKHAINVAHPGRGWIAEGPSGHLWPLVYWLPGLNFIRVPSRFSSSRSSGLACWRRWGSSA